MKQTALAIALAALLTACGSDTYVERTSYPEPVYVQPQPDTVIVRERPRVHATVRINP